MARIRKEEEYRLAKENLENALIELFYTKKLEDIKIKDICEKAGVGVGTFYHYYKNKEQILVERFRHVDNYLRENVRPIIEGLDFLEGYFGYLEAYMHLGKVRSREYMTEVFKSYLVNGMDELNYKTREIYMLLRDVIDKGVREGVLKEDIDVDKTAKYLNIALKGFVFNWCSTGDNSEEDRFEFMKIYLLGIVKDEHKESVIKFKYPIGLKLN